MEGYDPRNSADKNKKPDSDSIEFNMEADEILSAQKAVYKTGNYEGGVDRNNLNATMSALRAKDEEEGEQKKAA